MDSSGELFMCSLEGYFGLHLVRLYDYVLQRPYFSGKTYHKAVEYNA